MADDVTPPTIIEEYADEGELDEDAIEEKETEAESVEREKLEEWGCGQEEYGEGSKFILYVGEAEEEYPPEFPEVEGEYASTVSIHSAISAAVSEETEEEKALRLEKEHWLDLVKQKMAERTILRRKNLFLQKKLVEHFKKRRMDHVLKEDSKGLDMETKYLKRLYAFQEFKKGQDDQIEELAAGMREFKNQTDELERELDDSLKKFIQREKDFSINLILAKTGKKLSEKAVDRLLKRQELKFEEKGKCRLKYIKIKNLIEEKEKQLKAMESFGEGLHMMDYEQLKIDNQNFTDKIEEKEDELVRLRGKTHGSVQNLANVREKASAIEGDIENLERRYREVETKFNEARERVTLAKTKRDSLREEYTHLKTISGLLTNNRLLRDFESSIEEASAVSKELESLKKTISEKKRKEQELSMITAKPVNSPDDKVNGSDLDKESSLRGKKLKKQRAFSSSSGKS